MSVLRGLFLRRLIAVLPTKTFHSRKTTLLFTLACILGVLAVSTNFLLSGLAARRIRAEKSINTITKLPAMTSRGPLAPANANAAPFTPFQGCQLGCSATVPGTGNANAQIQFSASATTSGCSTQPTYDWNFGDGTPHSNQQNPTHAYSASGPYTWTLTTSIGSGAQLIDTIAGGLGEGSPIRLAPFGVTSAIARDPQGRGVYVADQIGGTFYIRFLNTSNAQQTLGGRTIASGTVRAIAGGGADFSTENIPGSQVDVGVVTGLAVSTDGN